MLLTYISLQNIILLFSLTHVMVEKVLFLGQIFEMLMDLHVLRPPKSENHIFNGWSARLFVSVCVLVCLLSALLKKKYIYI